MKKYFSHFCVGLLAVFMLILSCVPVFASSQSEYVQITNFLHWSKDVPIWGDFVSYSSSAICPVAEDGHHRASTYQSENVKEGYFDCICILCGKEFTAYESDLKQSYDNQVAELPATGITSAGRLIWQPTFADANANTSGSSDNYFRVSYYEGAYSCNVYLNAIPNCEAITIFSDNTGFICAYSNSYFKSRFGFYFNPVIAGSYRQIESLCYSYSCLDQSGTSYSGSVNYSAGTAFLHYDASTVLFSVRSSVFNICPDLSASATVTFGTVQYHFPVYEIIPDSAVDTSAGGQYSVTTRPTSITGGNYGIIGDDGEITTITNNNQIINETNNTYYNPATGESKPIVDWSYDYGDRTYNVTLEGGDTVQVTYGDEQITINQGDTVYNIYYIIDGSGSGDNPSPAPTACPHEWYKTGERQATCLVPAQRTYTCSICGEQKTETDPVLGHSWHVIQTVTTQYDENGNMTQEGYTIYECERCGEQYKSTNNTGPPPPGGGGSGGSSGNNIFSGIFGLIWDFFTFLFDLFSEFVVGGIKGFISGLKDAGSSFFSILNPFEWGY